MRETTTAATLAWSRVFPAVPAQVREARRFLTTILDGHPAADEAVLCLSELAANATLHSRSRNGGHYIVRTELRGQCLRVSVHDQGGPWSWHSDGDKRHGRGLLIVSQLARAWGRDGDESTGWIVWFEIDHSSANGGPPHDQHECQPGSYGLSASGPVVARSPGADRSAQAR
jgi:serine/threonine-protein kinase RsbW